MLHLDLGEWIMLGLIVLMWMIVILYFVTHKRMAKILWPWENRSVRYAILGRSNWHDITKSDYVTMEGDFDMSRYVEDLGAPDFLEYFDQDDGAIRLCTPEKGVFFDLYFAATDGEKMLNRIEKVSIRNMFEYILMPSKEVYSLTKEAKFSKPFYEYVVHGGNLARVPDFMMTGVALRAFCDGMSELAE